MAFINTKLCLSVCVFVNYSIASFFISLKTVDSTEDNNLKEEEERENVLSSFSSPLRPSDHKSSDTWLCQSYFCFSSGWDMHKHLSAAQ